MLKNKVLNLVAGLLLLALPACVKQDGNLQTKSEKLNSKIEKIEAEYARDIQASGLPNKAEFEKELLAIVEAKKINFKCSKLVAYTTKLSDDIIWLKKYGKCFKQSEGLITSLVVLRDKIYNLDFYKKEKKRSNWKKAGVASIAPGLVIGGCVVLAGVFVGSMILLARELTPMHLR